MSRNTLPDEPIRILISSCLLGEKVRYDGGHKRDPFLVETPGRFVEYVPVCPEVECGLPTPREAMRLVGNPSDPRLVTARTGMDQTAKMQCWARNKLREFEDLDLCGYICKKDSPSCGMEHVKVYDDGGIPARIGSGILTMAFMEHFPLVPVEEEDRLHVPLLRESFVDRVLTLHRLRETVRRGKSRRNLVEFHSDHKLLILTRSRTLYAEMGNLVARAKEYSPGDLYRRYPALLMDALRRRPTPGRCADVLMHAMGYFRRVLTSDEKRELLEVIDRYRNHRIPLAVPITLVRHYVRKYDVGYLKRQVFLHPHPALNWLRNPSDALLPDPESGDTE